MSVSITPSPLPMPDLDDAATFNPRAVSAWNWLSQTVIPEIEAITVDDIIGGNTLDGVTIGSTTPAAATFTTVTANTGIYLGGTAASNLLDDYEEGTWTPAIQNGTIGHSVQVGWYRKFGDLVVCGFNVSWVSKSGTGKIDINMPFSFNATANYTFTASTRWVSNVDLGSAGGAPLWFSVAPNILRLGYSVDNAGPGDSNIQDAGSAGSVQAVATFLAA